MRDNFRLSVTAASRMTARLVQSNPIRPARLQVVIVFEGARMLDLVGVWRLIASYVVVEGTGERTELLGPEPYAYAIFEPSGRMMAIGQAKNRAAGTSTAAMAELFRSMFAYSGKWSIDSKKFVTKVDLAADPGWVGTSQVRYYTSTGEHCLSERLPWSSQHFLGERPLSTRSGKRKVASRLLGARSSRCRPRGGSASSAVPHRAAAVPAAA